MDAASLIAQALKRKFAHRHRHDSEAEDDGEYLLPVSAAKPPVQTPSVRVTSPYLYPAAVGFSAVF